MKLNNKYFWLSVHIIAILIAIFTLICNLVPIIPPCCCDTLCWVAGVIGVLYLIVPIWNFFFNRPRFDWYIVKGNYLLKVVALVLLFPSVVTSGILLLGNKCSPKDLLNEDSLYPNDSASQKPAGPTIYWTVYSHFMDPGNQHMSSHKGRAWSALIAIFGVFLLNGLLVSSIIAWIDSRKEKWLKGEVEYPCFLRWKNHYVIIGGNDIVTGIVQQIMSKK